MKNKIIIPLILLLNIILINSSLGQNSIKNKIYSQKDFDKNKTFQNTYHLWSSKNRWFPEGDTTVYFVDDRNYKGVVNYGIEFHSKDYRTFDYIENVSMYFLNVDFKKCTYNPNDSIIEIEGFVSGGWSGKSRHGIENNIELFIGEKTDAKNACYFGDIINKNNIDIIWENKIVTDFAVLDSFPSFYFKNYSYYRTVSKGQRPFKIKAKVRKNTILAFGSFMCYSEIFEIGAMVFLPKKNKTKKRSKKPEMDNEPLIIKNKLVKDIVKEKAEEKDINYYSYTEKAESYILKKQYAKAKETYFLLAKEYQTLFARDIHNAIRCAILSRDFKTVFLWGEKLTAKGLGIQYFNAKIFNGLKKSAGWQAFSVRYDSLYKINQNKLNTNLKQQLEQLVDEDQKDYGLATRKEPQILYQTTERVTDKLIELLKKEGYPSEEKIGVYTKNDTILISSPDYNVLIRHAIQQKPKNLAILNEILDKSSGVLEYDKKRSPNHRGFVNSCFHVYKGNLYNNKSCENNDLMVRKIKFMFSNLSNFIVDQGDYIITEYDKENPEEYDTIYKEYFNFIMKLTDDWEFYED